MEKSIETVFIELYMYHKDKLEIIDTLLKKGDQS